MQVIDGIKADYLSPDLGVEEWGMLTELRLPHVYSDGRVSWERRSIDLVLFRVWGGKPKGFERIAVEVKVSRRDFLREHLSP